MFSPANIRSTIDSLHANVAVLDGTGAIIEVNEGWRRFGGQRNATSDYVGLNYLQVCGGAASSGDAGAERVEAGLRRLLKGEASSYGTAYRCADRIFRMSARRISQPEGGVVVAHQDITALLRARRERVASLQELRDIQRSHVARVNEAHEELGQRLAAISLAAGALESGGNLADAVTLIKLAVEEARNELKLLRYETARVDRPNDPLGV